MASFMQEHPDSKSGLRSWAQTIESNGFRHFVELKKTFGSADHVKPHTVFNISGNKYRIIALVHYQLQSVAVEEILTHKDYDRGKWRKS
ncbi:MAG: type II toxin-antitoxin system HigB family toxin [Elusimicrobia bacterium]|nr:type II toxin-antitoxin system HigB family toxin [Elusimicrobiota bacterium]